MLARVKPEIGNGCSSEAEEARLCASGQRVPLPGGPSTSRFRRVAFSPAPQVWGDGVEGASRLLGIGLSLLMGCASPARLTGPGDFPLHATDHPFFDLYWRLEREGGVVQAVGLVETVQMDGIAEVILELQGLDTEGRVVSRGRGSTYGGPLPRWQTRPFRVRLRPGGQKARFELRTWSYEWEGTRDRGARNGGR